MKKTQQGFFNSSTNKFQPAPVKKPLKYKEKEAKDYLNNIARMK